MSIKKSSLERKWYFRIFKVFYLILPIIGAFILLNGKINISSISQKTILDLLQKNIVYIIYAVVGLVIYYAVIPKLFLYLVFGGVEEDTQSSNQTAEPAAAKKTALIPILIIIGVITVFVLYEMGYLHLPQLNIIGTHTYGSACTDSNGKKGIYGTNGDCYTCSNNGTAATKPINNNCTNSTAGVYCCGTGDNIDGCISTNCGSMWYCSGSYYIGGQQINVPGLCYPTNPRDIYPSWSGNCRQCP